MVLRLGKHRPAGTKAIACPHFLAADRIIPIETVVLRKKDALTAMSLATISAFRLQADLPAVRIDYVEVWKAS
ncbi:UNVERIFIED_CONTAM: hypothetical protein NY603_38735, partial [Bacteroidetes bacterium 56_B9]